MRLFGRVWKEPRPSDAFKESFEELRSSLDLTPEQSLMLDTVPMVLMPRWFFVSIKQAVEKMCGPDTARKVYYQAGWEGAQKWARVQMEQGGLDGRAVMEQYMNSAGLRGWGRLSVKEYDENTGRVVVELTNSAVAAETGPSGKAVCDHLPGSIAGAMSAILEASGKPQRLIGREVECESMGQERCLFETGPEE